MANNYVVMRVGVYGYIPGPYAAATIVTGRPGEGAGIEPPSGPTIVTIEVAGTTDVATLGVPADTDVLVELWGGGAGGVGATSGSAPAAGGGGGGYGAVSVPAALWALGGSIVVGAGGTGGMNDSGQPGADSTLTLDAVVRLTAGGAESGDPAGLGGVGGGVIVGAGVSSVSTDDGDDGENAIGGEKGGDGGGAGGADGGAGGPGAAFGSMLPGSPGTAPGGGGGGAPDGSDPGGDGAVGWARITWPYTP